MFREIPQLRTVGVIAVELGMPTARVAYLLGKLGIRPIGRAGSLRVFDQRAVEAIRAAAKRKRAD